jgi:release factor glutamine methyltransferase
VNAISKATAQTVGALRHWASARLRDAGIESAELDARILLQCAISLDSASLLTSSEIVVPFETKEKFERLLQRRTSGEPIARIVGFKEFWSHSFRLGPDTLVPRPETETVVEVALEVLPIRGTVFRVLDLGTGSGILLASILLERPNATGVGIDHSEGALQFARSNHIALGLVDRARFICGNWADAIDHSFDLVVTNPPYIPSTEIAKLPREIRDHDPYLAVDGGGDGLATYRAIIEQLPHLLTARGVALLELGFGQESAVACIARAANLFVDGPARRDLSRVPRVLILRQQGQK